MAYNSTWHTRDTTKKINFKIEIYMVNGNRSNRNDNVSLLSLRKPDISNSKLWRTDKLKDWCRLPANKFLHKETKTKQETNKHKLFLELSGLKRIRSVHKPTYHTFFFFLLHFKRLVYIVVNLVGLATILPELFEWLQKRLKKQQIPNAKF